MAKKSKGKSKSASKSPDRSSLSVQIAEAERRIEELEQDKTDLEGQLQELRDNHLDACEKSSPKVDPYVLCSAIGVLRDSLSKGPMDDRDFESEAPRFIAQALRLYDMLEQAIQGRYAANQADQDEEDELEEASRKPKSPSLP